MQTVSPSEFKTGMTLMLDGAPHVVEDFHATGAAKTRHKLHARLRNLTTGRLLDRSFIENERVPVADVAHHQVLFSFQQGDTYSFLDSQTFEQLDLSAEQVGERRWFLKENEEYRALFLDGKLVDFALPATVVLQVTGTGPAQRGGSDSAWKSAKLENGLEIMVPLFIETGERIRVDTEQRKYVGRQSADKSH